MFVYTLDNIIFIALIVIAVALFLVGFLIDMTRRLGERAIAKKSERSDND